MTPRWPVPGRPAAAGRPVARRRPAAAGRPAATGRRGAGCAGALVTAALVLAGCGGQDRDRAPRAGDEPRSPAQRTDGSREEPSDGAQLLALVRDRAAALEAGDVAAYAATAVGAQRRRDRRAARRAGRLRLRDVTLEAESLDIEGRRARMRITGEYAIAGVRSSYEVERRAVAVRSRGRWRIRALRGGRGLAPWEVAAFGERRTRHFVVLAPPSVPVEGLLAALEDGYRRMRDLLPSGSLRRRYLVVVAGDAGQARRLTTEIRGVEALAALSEAAIREQGPERRVEDVVSLRVLLVWPPFSALDEEGRRRVVTHELTHAALAGATSGRTPAWLVEGLALWVSNDRRPAPPGADLAALSRPKAISRLSGDDQVAAYAASSAAAFAIEERFGRRRLLSLYDAFGDPELRGEPGRRLVNRALRRELGITLTELEAALG